MTFPELVILELLQLPALLLPGVTVVVSPLVALMVDQLKKLPSVIPGGLLSSSQVLNQLFLNLVHVGKAHACNFPSHFPSPMTLFCYRVVKRLLKRCTSFVKDKSR